MAESRVFRPGTSIEKRGNTPQIEKDIDLAKELLLQRNTIENLTNIIGCQKNDIENLNAAIENYKNVIECQKSDIENLNAAIENYKNVIECQKSDIENLNATIENLKVKKHLNNVRYTVNINNGINLLNKDHSNGKKEMKLSANLSPLLDQFGKSFLS